MKKKIMLLLLLMVSIAGITLSAKEIKADEEGDWIYWDTECNGTATIWEYIGNDEIVTIPDTLGEKPVVAIRDAFRDNTTIKKVIIPDGVKKLNTGTFLGCTSLEEIEIPESVETMSITDVVDTKWYKEYSKNKDYVTVNKILLEVKNPTGDVYIPEGIEEVNCSGFYSNDNITGIFFSEGVKRIIGSFGMCKNLKEIYMADSVEYVEGDFMYCTALKTVKLSNNLKEIPAWCFMGCESIENIEIPDNATRIGNMAFESCKSLVEIYIPGNCKIGDAGAPNDFSNCTSLRKVTIGEGMKVLEDNCFPFFECASLKEVVLPETLEKIGSGAFYGCISLKSIIVPKSVKEIGEMALGYYRTDDYVIVDDNNSAKITDFTIYGTKGTEAERYAKENGFRFVEAGTLDDATDASANVGNGSLSENVDDLNDKVLNDEERKALKDGNVVTVYITINDADSTVSTEDKSMVENGLKNSVLGMYLNINLFSKVGNNEARQVTDTNGAVKIKFTVPDKLLNKDKSIERTYQIVRIHNGKRTVIDVTFNNKDNTISFESDKFSTYALVYTDKKAGAPDAGDVNVLTVLAALLAVSAGTVTLGLIKKRI